MKRLALVLGLWATLAASPAEARVQRDVRYRYDQVWNTLVRLLRVDYRFPVDESDRENGFVLFRYREYGRDHAASIELVRIDGTAETDEQVRLIVQIESVPSDTENRVAEALEAKLRADYGVRREAPSAERDRAPLVPRLSPRRVDDYADPEPTPPPGASPAPPAGSPSPGGSSPTPSGDRGSSPSPRPDDGTVSPGEAQPDFPPPSSRRRRR